jgi:gamma-glutamyltranspeptidase/glutathione hydrolase
MHALRLLEPRRLGSKPGPETYLAYAACLYEAYRVRLATLGEVAHAPTATTTFSIVDAEGNIVVVTQTLMSGFGSKVRLPSTGVILNNGMLWFDPVPGRPNSMAPGKRPLSNMAPTVVLREDAPDFGLGALGGRRIFPAVLQLLSFVHDFGMDLEAAFHHPRIDVSGGPAVTVDPRLRGPVLDALEARYPVMVEQAGVQPDAYAVANAVMHAPSGEQTGAVHVTHPWATVAAA